MASSKKSTAKNSVATVETETPATVQDTPQPSENGTSAQRSEPKVYPIEMIEIAKIRIPDNVRPNWEHLDFLEYSMPENGQIQPIGVTQDGDMYDYLWGHNRIVAAKNVGYTHIRAEIRDYAKDDIRRELVGFEENVIRDELNHLEYAEALERMKEIHEKRHPGTRHGKGRTKQQNPESGSCKAKAPAFLTEKTRQLGWSRSKLSEYLYLYKHLLPEVRALIRTHEMVNNLSELSDLAHVDADIQLRVARLLHDEPQMIYDDALRQAAPEVVEEREERMWNKQRYPGKGEQDDIQDDLNEIRDEESEDEMMGNGDTGTKTPDGEDTQPDDTSETYVDPLRKAINEAKELCSHEFFPINEMIKSRKYLSLDQALYKIESWLDRFVVDSPYGLYVDREHNTVSITFKPFKAPDDWQENHPEDCPGWRLFNPKEKVCKGCSHQKGVPVHRVAPGV